MHAILTTEDDGVREHSYGHAEFDDTRRAEDTNVLVFTHTDTGAVWEYTLSDTQRRIFENGFVIRHKPTGDRLSPRYVY